MTDDEELELEDKDWEAPLDEPPKSQAVPPKPPPRPPPKTVTVTPKKLPPVAKPVAPPLPKLATREPRSLPKPLGPFPSPAAEDRPKAVEAVATPEPVRARAVRLPQPDDVRAPAEAPERALEHGRYRIHSADVEHAAPAAEPPRAPLAAFDWLDHLLATDSSSGSASADAESASERQRFEADRPGVATSSERFEADAGTLEPGEAASGERWEHGLCTFWIGPRCFALDIDIVGEVVDIDTVVDVPLTPAALVGLFNLRGMPVALVDLARVLNLEGDARAASAPADSSRRALVLRAAGITAAALIDRVEAVVPPGREVLIRTQSGDNPIVLGLIKPSERRAAPVITVLDAHAVIARIQLLKHLVGAGVT